MGQTICPIHFMLPRTLILFCLAPLAHADFRITAVHPEHGAHDVSVDAAIQVHVSARFDVATISGETVRLWRGGERVEARVTSDLGGVITISPDAPLMPEKKHRVEITAALKSAAGEVLTPFESSFKTGRAAAKTARALPPFRKTKIAAAPGITSLALGPDQALYAATWEGALLRWSLDEQGKPIGDAHTLWHPQKTRITALCFDPDATSRRQLWVALDDNAGQSVCELRFTAKIVRLTLSNEEDAAPLVQDFITGLPVGDHAVSGLTFGPDGQLYFYCGAITMLGGETERVRETPLSAAVLSADVHAPGFTAVNVNADSPVNYDWRAVDAPVQIFATGIREAYDLCWHGNGSLYAGVNQNDTGERTPENQARGLPAVSARPDEPLIRIVGGGYYGHPNPAREEWVLMGGNPTAGRDPWEVSELPVGTLPERHFAAENLIANLVPLGGQSADGCAEWRGEGPLQGRLLIAFYTSARTIHTFAFSADGTQVVAEEPLCDNRGSPLKFGAPLDLVIDDAHGRVYVADFADSRRNDSAKEGAVWLLTPAADH
jgi:hypothetical protein